MTVFGKPNDIARETLRLLITRGEAPTPENYRRRYREIAGNADEEQAPAAETTADWTELLHQLVRLVRENHFGLSAAEKQAALDKSLAGGGDTRALCGRLRALATAWAQLPIVIPAADAANQRHATADDAGVQPAATELRELLARTLEVSVATRLIDVPALAAQATGLTQRLRAAAPLDSAELRSQLHALWGQLEFAGNRCDEIQTGLVRLLRI